MMKTVTACLSLLLVLSVCAFPCAGEAQQPVKLPKIGWLQNSVPSFPAYEGFRQGLRALGYIEGQNVVIEARSVGGDLDRLPEVASELARLGVDVLYVGGDQGLRAAKAATTTIPIVVLACDPLDSLIVSIARPGGSATGFTCISSELAGKRLELLREIVPGASRIAVLYNPKDLNKAPEYRLVEAAAQKLQTTTRAFEIGEAGQFANLFAGIVEWKAQAASILADAQVNFYVKRLADLALENRLPAIYGFREFADAGGLLSYGANLREEYRLTAAYIDKILKGAKPGDLPVQEPTKFELIINLKTAKALGIAIPQQILLRADEVIE
jgi:putative ABC transport system substrate-binding protein